MKVAKKPPEPSPSIPSVPGGIPTVPGDDNGGDDGGGDDEDKDKDKDSMGGGLFDNWSEVIGN